MRRTLVTGFTLGALAAAAHADASLSAVRGEDVSEGAYTLDVDLRGLHAVVEVRQTFVNPSATDAETVYEFDLPSSAVVDGASVAIPGKRDEAGFGADASAAITPGADDGVRDAVPDAALLRVIDHADGDPSTGAPDLTRYELRVYPIPAKKAVTVRTRFVVPLEIADGRVILRLPDRGDAANLSRETGEVRFHATGGILAYDHLHIDEADVPTSGRTVKFTHSRRGTVVLDATPRVRGNDPLVWFDTSPIDAKRGTVELSYFVPRVATSNRLPFDRIAILVDTSRSMDGAVDGAARVVDAILAQASPAAQIQPILFARTPHAIGGWHAIDAASRAELGKAIHDAALTNGSELAEAMSAAGMAIGDADVKANTLVVVVTDGLTPLDASALDLVQRVGGPRPGLTASFVLVTPDHAALPDVLHGVLADVANRTGGMVISVRNSEVASRAAGIAAELGNPAPLHDASLAGAERAPALELPEVLSAGSGGVLVAPYDGGAPSTITLIGTRIDRAIRVGARRSPAQELGDLAIAALVPSAIARSAPDTEPTQGEADAARDLLAQTWRSRGLVTDETSLVAIDSRARFSAERRKMGVEGGPFVRMPPPGESRVGARAPQVRVGTVHLSGDLDARLIHGMLETGLLPRARACFQPLLLQQRESEGTVNLELQLSRGELTSARIAKSDFPSSVNTCLVDAAYDLDVPRTLLDDVPDTVYLVHYPLTFRSLAAGEVVLPGDADSSDPIDTGIHVDDTDQPLSPPP